MSASAPQRGAEVTREGGEDGHGRRHRGESSSHHVTSTQKGEKEGRQIKETRDEKGHRTGKEGSKRCEMELLVKEIIVRQTIDLRRI